MTERKFHETFFSVRVISDCPISADCVCDLFESWSDSVVEVKREAARTTDAANAIELLAGLDRDPEILGLDQHGNDVEYKK